jgi:membrane protein DedA with SNARE-associated domain
MVLGLQMIAINVLAGIPTGRSQVFDRLVTAVFDPAWNEEHRLAIGGVILAVLFLSGVGLPLPEDIPLTLAGFTIMKQAHDVFVPGHFAVAFVLLAIPILGGDIIAYTLGMRYGLGLTERFHILRRVLTEARRRRVQHWFDRYHAFAVFMGRQVAGVRFVTFFTAGSMRVPLSKFVSFDFLGCLVSVPVWLTLGALASRFGEPWARGAMHRVGNGILVVAAAIILLFFVITRLRKRRDGHTLAHGSEHGH